MKKITTHPREDVCLLYLYYYNQQMAEEQSDCPMRPTSTTSSTNPAPVQRTESSASMEAENVPKKRDGPETRTVVISP